MVKIYAGKEFSPVDSSSVANNSLFLDVSDNILKKKDNTGTVTTIGESGSSGSSGEKSSLRFNALNLIRQIENGSVTFTADGGEFGEAYTDANGQLNSVDTVNTTAVFDTDKYIAATLYSSTSSYVIISATNISSISDFNINNCKIYSGNAGNWILFCDDVDEETSRANIMKTLFYGTDGTDPRASNTYITGVTKLLIKNTSDIGKRGNFIKATINTYYSSGNTVTVSRSFSFNNTSSNNSSSLWANNLLYVSNNNNSSSTVYFPTGSNVNSISNNSAGTYTNNDIGTDTSATNQDNPTDIKLQVTGTVSSTYAIFNIICLSDGSLTTNSGDGTVNTKTDFYSDNGIPLFEDGSNYNLNEFAAYIIHNISYTSFPESSASYSETTEYSQYGSTGIIIIDRTGLSKKISELHFEQKSNNGSHNSRVNAVFTYLDGDIYYTNSVQTNSTTYVNGVIINPYPAKTVTEIQIYLSANASTTTAYLKNYSEFDVSEIIGSFSNTFKNSFLTAKVVDWEEGANIQYKLTNDTEDTGYGDYNEILSAATAFTSEPTTIYVKLIPKSSSPTAGYPSISGIGIYEL